MLTKNQKIKNLVKLVRKQILGKRSTQKGVPEDFVPDVESSLGIKVLYTDSNECNSISLFDTDLHRPVIILARKLSTSQRFYYLSREIGGLFMSWNYQVMNGLDKNAYKFLNKHKQMFNNHEYVLDVSPNDDIDNTVSYTDMDKFAKYLLE